MARYDHLPIYGAVFELTMHLEQIVWHFDRYHKYALGTDLRTGSRCILERIIEANESPGTNGRSWNGCARTWSSSKVLAVQGPITGLPPTRLPLLLRRNGESAQAARLSSSTARNQGTTRFQLAKVWLTRFWILAGPTRRPAPGEPARSGRPSMLAKGKKRATPLAVGLLYWAKARK